MNWKHAIRYVKIGATGKTASALDNEAERKINESFEVCGDKTIIVVAHREFTLRNVERLLI